MVFLVSRFTIAPQGASLLTHLQQFRAELAMAALEKLDEVDLAGRPLLAGLGNDRFTAETTGRVLQDSSYANILAKREIRAGLVASSSSTRSVSVSNPLNSPCVSVSFTNQFPRIGVRNSSL